MGNISCVTEDPTDEPLPPESNDLHSIEPQSCLDPRNLSFGGLSPILNPETLGQSKNIQTTIEDEEGNTLAPGSSSWDGCSDASPGGSVPSPMAFPVTSAQFMISTIRASSVTSSSRENRLDGILEMAQSVDEHDSRGDSQFYGASVHSAGISVR